MLELTGKYNKAKVFTENIDEETIGQVIEMLNQEYMQDCTIRIMPDCHKGKGCTIGTTIKFKDKVSPSLVGVDISCGMLVIQIPKEIKLNLEKID